MSVGSRFKPVYWRLVERFVLKSCAAFHATSEEEFSDIRKLGFDQPVAIIPNGIDLPKVVPSIKKRQVLFLGRLHYEKDVISLIEAWSNVSRKFPDFELIIAGSGDASYVNRIRDLIASKAISRIILTGQVEGEAKFKLLRESWVLVLPSPSENFGMVVAEALSYQTIAIANKGSPWSSLNTNKCGFWIEKGQYYMEEALSQALSLDENTLQEMGSNGRNYVELNFSWSNVCGKMTEFYNWVSRGGDKPLFVRVD
jgi:glycosyltransferase involved in cell wall biosynthesis